MRTNAKHLAIAAASAVVWLAPAAALAQDSASPRSTDLPSIRVSYADLNVESEAGMQALTRRVRSAVRRVCQVGFAGSNIELHEAITECQRSARNDAWAQFGRNQERARALRGTLIAATPNRSREY